MPASYQAPRPMTSTERLLPSSIPSISSDTILLQQSVISYLDCHSYFLVHLIISHLFPLQFILLKCHLTGLQEIVIFHSLAYLKLLLPQSGIHTPPQSRQSIFPHVSLISLPDCSFILKPLHQDLAHTFIYMLLLTRNVFPSLFSLPKLYLCFKAQLKSNLLHKISKHPCPQGFLSLNFYRLLSLQTKIYAFKCNLSILIIHSYTYISIYRYTYIFIHIYVPTYIILM